MARFAAGVIAGMIFVAASPAVAQPQQPSPFVVVTQGAIPANPADVASVDAIMAAIYDAISGAAGERRDWNRLRSLFTANANAYLSDEALADFKSSLAPLGQLERFEQTATRSRGGMTLRVYRAVFPGRVLRVWTYETADGKLEQYQVAPAA